MFSFWSILRQVIRSWKNHFFLLLGSLVVISCSLTLIFSILLFFSNSEKALVSWGSSFDINIFLKDGLKVDEISKIKTSIGQLGYFKNIDLVTQQDASEKFFSKMSRYIPDFINQKDFSNLIPASFVASLAQKVNISDLQKISSQIQSIVGVQDISYGQDWLDGLASFLNLLKKMGWALSIVLALGCFFVIAFSVYAILSRRREEIEVFELCGATAGTIRAPFIFESVLLSTISAIIAIILSYIILGFENKYLVSKMGYLGFNTQFLFASVTQIIIFIFLCAIAGAAVSAFCAMRINTGWAQAERESRA